MPPRPHVVVIIAALAASGASAGDSDSDSDGDRDSDGDSDSDGAAADIGDLRVAFPEGDAQGVLVVVVPQSLFEAEPHAVDAISDAAHARGLVALFAVVTRVCGDSDECWAADELDGAAATFGATLADVEREAGRRLRDRNIVGWSSGAFLVGGMLQRGLLGGFARAGVVDGGGVGDALAPRLTTSVSIEASDADPRRHQTTVAFFELLASHARHDVRMRAVRGAASFDADRARAFLAWFFGDEEVVLSQPRVRRP